MNNTTKIASPFSVLGFWLDLEEHEYWQKNTEFDNAIRKQFKATLDAATTGGLDDWCSKRESTLALTIVLDQFARNIHRGTPLMFANDEQARAVANFAFASKLTTDMEENHMRWLIMPFMHSERLQDQKYCVAMCQRHELNGTLPHAVEHMEIIKQFGRFPHRNEILGRESTHEEIEFLANGGFAG